MATEAKFNKITAILEIEEPIALKGTVITIDAMGTQREIFQQIVAGGADDLLPTKGNQPTLEAAVKAAFDSVMEQGVPSWKVSVFETQETGHGRREKRTRMGHAPKNETWLRRFAGRLLKQHPNDKLSVAMKRRKAGWHENFVAEVLFSITT